MAEPNTSATLGYLRDKITRYLGIGVYSSLSAGEQGRVDDVIKRGCRRFWFPPVLPGEAVTHEWSFLRPTLAIATVIDQVTYALPDDWGGPLNSLTYYEQDRDGEVVPIIGEFEFRRFIGDESRKGRPMVAMLRQKDSFAAATGQRWELSLAPKPDAVYNLRIRYQSVPQVPTTATDFFVGGPMHSETLLESCLAVAELEERDEQGPHFGAFIESLRASVARDRQMSMPMVMGMMRTDHEGPPILPRTRIRTNSIVTYDGTIY